MEIATYTNAIDPEAWIDPAVVEATGISAEELARYKSPDPYEGEGGTVAQPPVDPIMTIISAAAISLSFYAHFRRKPQ